MAWFESRAKQRMAALRKARVEMPPVVIPEPPPSTHLARYWREFEMSPHNASVVYDAESGIIRAVPNRTKFLIYGAGLGKEQAPLEDPSWLVWGLNAVPPLDSQNRLRADAWWDIHQHVAQNADDMRWIQECPFPIYVPEDLQTYGPTTARYPLAQIEAAFGLNYWSCTFAYQIAMALHMGATDIGLYGVELAYGTSRERTVEWACVSYWLGRAAERGVQIHTPDVLPMQTWLPMLLKHPARYGFEYSQELDAIKDYTDEMEMADRYRRLSRNQTGMGG